MVCSVCGQPIESSDRFCFHCGAPVESKPKKGRWWPPVLALVLMFAIGLAVFFVFRAEPVISTDAAMPWFTVRDGVLYFNESLYSGGSELTVPASVDGQTVTAIGDSCFAFCTELTAIHLPEGITYIGTDAFWGCESLRGIRLPETLTTIGDYAFDECYSLEAVCIPYSLTQCGTDVFANCESLSYVFYPGPITHFEALNIDSLPSGLTIYSADGLYIMD